jgi:hypothetical protein
LPPVNIGSNLMFGVPFPLVLADRFFHVYNDGGQFRLDVFRWDAESKTATYEVMGGEPQNEAISTNPTGIVTFSEEPNGGFLFKFRPKPGLSQIFGKVPMDTEWVVHINDRSMSVERGGTTVATLERNQFHGMPIAFELGADGSMGIGVNRLPDGMQLVSS